MIEEIDEARSSTIAEYVESVRDGRERLHALAERAQGIGAFEHAISALALSANLALMLMQSKLEDARYQGGVGTHNDRQGDLDRFADAEGGEDPFSGFDG
jgi:hypothetical protein